MSSPDAYDAPLNYNPDHLLAGSFGDVGRVVPV